jgi:hypothetical protein
LSDDRPHDKNGGTRPSGASAKTTGTSGTGTKTGAGHANDVFVTATPPPAAAKPTASPSPVPPPASQPRRSHAADPVQPRDRYEESVSGARDRRPTPMGIAGRFLLNLAVVSLFYFLVTGFAFDFGVVLLISAAVTASAFAYPILHDKVPGAFWVLVVLGAIITALGIWDWVAPDGVPEEGDRIEAEEPATR